MSLGGHGVSGVCEYDDSVPTVLSLNNYDDPAPCRVSCIKARVWLISCKNREYTIIEIVAHLF